MNENSGEDNYQKTLLMFFYKKKIYVNVKGKCHLL